MQGTRQPAPPPPTISITGRHRPILSPPTTAPTPENSDPGLPDFGDPSDSVYTPNPNPNTRPHSLPSQTTPHPLRCHITLKARYQASQPLQRPSQAKHARRYRLVSAPLPSPSSQTCAWRPRHRRLVGCTHARARWYVRGLVTRQADGQARDGGPLMAGRCRQDSVCVCVSLGVPLPGSVWWLEGRCRKGWALGRGLVPLWVCMFWIGRRRGDVVLPHLGCAYDPFCDSTLSWWVVASWPSRAVGCRRKTDTRGNRQHLYVQGWTSAKLTTMRIVQGRLSIQVGGLYMQ